ncbi:MAG: glycoside hydrolase family 2 protein [Anaerolineae bacterium]
MIRTISLDGAWHFRERSSSDWQVGQVPGCVQLDLLHLGEVPDPFYRLNEIAMYALEEKEWVYARTFTLDAEDLHSSAVQLVFEGIDTLADVFLNDVHLGRVENMFTPHVFDVSDLVRVGENRVEVRFESPTTAIAQMVKCSPFSLASSCDIARPYIRKAQYNYGWDWGPRITQVGLWRPVSIRLIDRAAVVDPFCYTVAIANHSARLRVTANVDSYVQEKLTAEVTLSLNGQVVARTVAAVEVGMGATALSADLKVANPAFWWPNGMGSQPLYDVSIRLLAGDALVDESTFRTGIRTVEIIQEPDTKGKTFIVAVNGVKVFCKGADWIPADSLLPRLTRDDYYQYITLTRDANMNMLRIWGGGIYEDPAFYEACDEMGIMVWQDFMYACAQYPDEMDWFQDQARDEAVSVVTALRNHPSIVLWCGNNENNWGFDEWWHNGVPKYLGNYVYREILPDVCATLDPSRPYWVSSPYGGEHPNCAEEGDRHQWTVWSNWQDFDGYKKDTGRFLSEFGFQAMPNWKTVLSFTEPEDRSILSPVILGHNKMVEGTERLVRFLAGRVGFPKDLQSFTYLTQFNQAEAIKTGVEHWRQHKYSTSGTLYWQLNDCWPVASWACLDYYKRKKGLYYYSRRFYDQILPVLDLKDDQIVLRVVNDLRCETVANARVAAYRLDGTKLAERTFDLLLPGDEVVTAKKFDLAELGIGYSPRVLPRDGVGTTNPVECNGELLDAVLYVEVQAEGLTYRNYKVFDRFRSLALKPAAIQAHVVEGAITLTSSVPAFGVFVEPANDVDLDDNCLILEPGVPYTVRCSGIAGETQVFSLTDLVARI